MVRSAAAALLLALGAVGCTGPDRTGTPGCAPGAPCAWFEEVADARGLGGPAPAGATAAGVAIGDADGDGRADVVRSGPDHARLWLQDSAGDFRDATAAAGFDAVTADEGVVFADFDGDGDLDLTATAVSAAHDLWLLENDGAGHFTDRSAALGFGSTGNAAGPAWADYDADGDLDLFVARYDTDPAATDTLWRNDDAALFTDVTAAAGVGGDGTLSFQALWLDYDGDADPDLYVSNDKATRASLFRNEGDGTFADVSAAAGVDLPIEGMGVGAADLDRDGRIDLYVANVPDTPPGLSNLLHLGGPAGAFVEAARDRGAALDRWSWGVAPIDPDLDGDLDVYVAVGSEADGASNALLENDGAGRFTDATAAAGVVHASDSYGVASGDVDGDGLEDLLVANRFFGPSLLYYRHRAAPGAHWLVVRLTGTGRNVHAIGALVTVEAGDDVRTSRELRAGEGLLGGGPPELCFALGAHDRADRVTVRWPGGAAPDTVRTDVPTGAVLTVAP
jgi:hypothetical protein